MKNNQPFDVMRWLELRHQILADIDGLSDSELREFKRLSKMAEQAEKKESARVDFYRQSYFRKKKIEEGQGKLL